MKWVPSTPVAAGSSGSSVGAHEVARFDVASVRALRSGEAAQMGRQRFDGVLTEGLAFRATRSDSDEP